MDKTLVFALVAALASAGYSAPAGDSWENRPTAARNDRADRWWCDTWRMGDHVETKYAYQFTGRLTASPETAGNVRWWQFVNKYIDREMSAEISGSSEATTDVLMGVGPKGEPLPPGVDIQLRRTYGSPMSYRGLAVVGPTNGLEMEKMLRTAIVAFVDQVDDPKVQEKVEALAQMATPGVRVASCAQISSGSERNSARRTSHGALWCPSNQKPRSFASSRHPVPRSAADTFP